jgi:predicted dienelactone hydrolase
MYRYQRYFYPVRQEICRTDNKRSTTRKHGRCYWNLRRYGILLTSSFLICTTAPQEARAEPKRAETVFHTGLGISERFDDAKNFSQCKMAELQCAVWEPEKIKGPVPPVIFSHGFKGSNTQTAFLMKALAKAGYLVVAPNHQDALSRSSLLTRPEIGFLKSEEWTENTYKSRRDDILNLLAALKSEPSWNNRLDWGKLALVGHSLGG